MKWNRKLGERLVESYDTFFSFISYWLRVLWDVLGSLWFWAGSTLAILAFLVLATLLLVMDELFPKGEAWMRRN